MNSRNPAKLQVMLAHPNIMTSRLLTQALEKNPDIKVVACARDLDTLGTELDRLSPDVMLLSTHVHDLTSQRLRSLRAVTEAYPSIPCVLLMDESVPGMIVDAFRAGARGAYCCEDGDTAKLEKCLRWVADGQIWTDAAQLQYIVSALPRPRVPVDRSRRAANALLTPREDQVMRLVAEGMMNRDIAAQLHLSENTVKNYLFKIYEKLGFSNRVELVLYAAAHPPLEGAGPADPENLGCAEAKRMFVPGDTVGTEGARKSAPAGGNAKFPQSRERQRSEPVRHWT